MTILRWSASIALVVTFILCYIDEGYYNFQWMRDPSNWAGFMIYVTILTFIFYGISFLINNLISVLRRSKHW